LSYFGAQLDTAAAAQLFGVTPETVQAWQSANLAPAEVWRALLAMAGEFEAVDKAWKGWRIQKGKLYAPDLADGFTPGQIRALPFLHGALKAYRRQAVATQGAGPPENVARAPGLLAALAGQAPAGRWPRAGAETDPQVTVRPEDGPTVTSPHISRAQSGATRGARVRAGQAAPKVIAGQRGSAGNGLALAAPLASNGRAGDTGAAAGEFPLARPILNRRGQTQGWKSVTAAPEVFSERQGDEAIERETESLSMGHSPSMKVRRKPQQVGHGKNSDSKGDITLASERYKDKREIIQLVNDITNKKAGKKGKGSFDLVGQIDKPQEAAAAGAAWSGKSPEKKGSKTERKDPGSHNRYYVKLDRVLESAAWRNTVMRHARLR
jgi:hypothetical protein